MRTSNSRRISLKSFGWKNSALLYYGLNVEFSFEAFRLPSASWRYFLFYTAPQRNKKPDTKHVCFVSGWVESVTVDRCKVSAKTGLSRIYFLILLFALADSICAIATSGSATSIMSCA